MRLVAILALAILASPAVAQWGQPAPNYNTAPFLAPPSVQPYGYQPSRPLETFEEQRSRQDANRYWQDRQSGGQPLGGYREPLGDARPFAPARPRSW